MKKRALRIEPYESNPIDRDGDGIVQEGTAWERPAGTRLLDALGREIAAGATSETRPKNSRVVDQSGKTVKYIASYEAGQSLDRSIGDKFRRVGDAVGGTLGQRFGGLNVSRNPPRPDFPRTVNVAQLGSPTSSKPDRPSPLEVFRQGIISAFRRGEKWKKVDKPFSEYNTKEQEAMVKNYLKWIPFMNVVAGDESLSPEERMENIIKYMVDHADELARQAGMTDEKGQLTEQAQIARQWYRVAHDFNEKLAEKYGIRSEAVHAVTAIFSKGTDWELNTAIAANAVKVVAENPVMTSDVVEAIKESRSLSIFNNINDKKNRLEKAEKEVADLKALRKSAKSKAEKDKISEQITKKENIIEKRKETIEEKEKSLEEIENKTTEEWFASEGGKIDAPLREQPPAIAGRFLFMQEQTGLNGEELREFRFNVNPDGSYDISIKNDRAVSKHSPEIDHGNVFKILREAFDGNEEDLYELIQVGLGNGNKVRSFYNNMSDPDDSDLASVTVDTHQAGLLLGFPVPNDDPYIKDGIFGRLASLGGPAMYASMVEATTRFAQKHGLLPREAQSILWEAQRLMWNQGSSAKKNSAMKRVKEFSQKDNVTPEQLRAFLWETQKETFGDVVAAEPELYPGYIYDILPETISVRDAPEAKPEKEEKPKKEVAPKKKKAGARKKVAGTRKAAPAKAAPAKAAPSRNKKILSDLAKSGSSEFGKPDDKFVNKLLKKQTEENAKKENIYAHTNSPLLTGSLKVHTTSEVTEARKKGQNYQFDYIRDALEAMSAEQMIPDENGMIIVDGNAMHPDVADFILNSSNEELAQALSETAKKFADGVDPQVRVRMRTGSAFTKFLRDKKYKTTHDEGLVRRSSGADIRRQYEASLGIMPDANPELRPVSGYVVHEDWRKEAIRQFRETYGYEPPEHLDIDKASKSAYGHAGGVEGYGGVEIVLKKDVAGRSAYGRGDSLKKWLHPSRFGEEDPEMILNAIILNQANSGLMGSAEEDVLSLLEARRTQSFVGFNGADYFEALIAGGFDFSDIEEIRIPYAGFQKLSEDPDELIKSVKEEFFSTERLRKLGFSEEEIKYILNAISKDSGKINLNELLTKARELHAADLDYGIEDVLPIQKSFLGDDWIKELLIYRNAKKRVAELEALGIKATLIDMETDYKNGKAQFSRLDPRYYGVETEEEIEELLIKRIVEGMKGKAQRAMNPQTDEVDRFPRGLG